MVNKLLDRLKGIVFDLDGTIVDSKLNFSLMRKDLGISGTNGILEEIDKVGCSKEKLRLHGIVRDHEIRGAKEAELMSGFQKFYNYMKKNNVPTAILTRNSQEVTELTLKKFNLEFDIIVSRDNCEAKPSPAGLIKVMDAWNVKPNDIIYIGDSEYDLLTAKNAEVESVLFKSSYNRGFTSGKPDYTIECFSELIPNS